MTEERWKEIEHLINTRIWSCSTYELYDYCVSLRGEIEESFKRDAVHGLHASNINRKLNETLTELAGCEKELQDLRFLFNDLAKRVIPGDVDSTDALRQIIREHRESRESVKMVQPGQR